MPPNHGSSQSQHHKQKGQRCILSARAQTVLTWILEDIIEKTLEDAQRLATAAHKQRVELTEVEQALKGLCERYHTRWSSETKARSVSKSRKHLPKRL